MKNNKARRTLCLKKETVAALSDNLMGNARGGCTTVTMETCINCVSILFEGRTKESDNTCFTQEPETVWR